MVQGNIYLEVHQRPYALNGFELSEVVSRSGSNLVPPRLLGTGAVRTQVCRSLRWEGVRLYNSLLEDLKKNHWVSKSV